MTFNSRLATQSLFRAPLSEDPLFSTRSRSLSFVTCRTPRDFLPVSVGRGAYG